MTEADRGNIAEIRSSLENPDNPITYSRLVDILGANALSSSGVNVTVENAMGVPAIWAGVNFISGTIAGLPLKLYRKASGGRQEIGTTRLAHILHDNVNEEMSSFAWRKYAFERLLTNGRSFTLIVRGEREPVRYLWPIPNEQMTVRKTEDGRKEYKITKGMHKGTYPARDVIDLCFAMAENGLDHYSPIVRNKDTIGLAIAATQWGSKMFQNGGVPPFVLTGTFKSAGALARSQDDLEEAVRRASKDDRLALSLPDGHTISPIGIDPEKMQLVELKKFLIEEVARIYSLPPTFLQDLSHGTFSNTEQQDLHFVKHTIKRWVEQFEQELNLKLFGWNSHSRYVEFNLDGLLRGDFKTRMDGYAQGIQNALITPNEARRRENMPDQPNGDNLLIQGATVPLGSQQETEEAPNEGD